MALFLSFVAAGSVFAAILFSSEPLEIHSGTRIQRLSVELAISPEQRERGLMERKTLADDRGMLFDFGTSRRVTMWMRNTLLPLDMLFADENGIVKHIHENAVPLSEAIIDSRSEVRFVLELNGGAAKRLAISIGDRLISPQIDKAR